MEDCIFCQIVAGKSPSYKVYEDDKYFGFLDIFPKSKGHTLLIPKKHYAWAHDVPDFGEYWETARKIARGIEKALNPNWMQFFTYGLIPHAHIHILPRYDDVKNMVIIPASEGSYSKDEMNKIAEKIRNAL